MSVPTKHDRLACFVFALFWLQPAGAFAQCQSTWDPSFGVPGIDGIVYALVTFDGGSGPALYAGGSFANAGGVSADNIAKWDGSSWSALGSGVNGPVNALAVFDDGGGDALYVGGFFTMAGSAPANNIAKWDGSNWSALGSGVDSGVLALAAFDDGGGPELYVGGVFTQAGGVPRDRIASWNGSSWSSLGSGISGAVMSLAVFNDGGGQALYAGGSFGSAGGNGDANYIAKWNGSAWSDLDEGMDNEVEAMAVFNDGSGPGLYASGDFSLAGNVSVSYIAKWNGSSWSPLGSGMNAEPGEACDGTQPGTCGAAALMTFDDGGGEALYAGGFFGNAGGMSANHIAKWNGSNWSALGSGTGDVVYALGEFTSFGVSALLVGGGFTTAGGWPSANIARWGTSCTVLEDDFNNGSLDPQWAVNFGANANGWSFFESGVQLTVTDISTDTRFCNNLCPARGNVMLTRPVAYLGDFQVVFDFSWDSLGTINAMQLVTVYLIGVNDAPFAWASYVDAWGAGSPTPGRQQATIAGDQFAGPNNLPDAGEATIEIVRVGGDITIYWNAVPIHSGTDSTLLSKVRIEFSHYDEIGSNGGGVPCPAHPSCNLPANHPASTFGELAVDWIRVAGTPSPIRYVNQTANGLNNGSNWVNAYQNLQDALADAAAIPGSVTEIWVAKGTYRPDRGGGETPGDRTATFQLLDGVGLYGGFAGGETLLSQRDPAANATVLSGDLSGDDIAVSCTQDAPDCDSLGKLCVNGACIIKTNNAENSFHVVTASNTDATAVLDSFTIVAGNANASPPNSQGGGIRIDTGSPSITQCVFKGNYAGTFGGGGISIEGTSNPTITDCTFQNNYGILGGAITIHFNAPSLTNCTFRENAADQGGGLFNIFASPTLTDCSFSKNVARNRGGGVYVNDGGPILKGCAIIENTSVDNAAGGGGGIYSQSNDPMTFVNCNISGNTSGQAGGGLLILSGGIPAIINCVLSGNSAATFGGALSGNLANWSLANSTVSNNSAQFAGALYINGANDSPAVVNSILWGNGANPVLGGTPTVNHSIVQGGWTGAGSNNLSSDPLFFDPDGADNVVGTIDDNLRLRAGSPAIDSGNIGALPLDTADIDNDADTSETLPLDLEGNDRVIFVIFSNVDRGAYEYFPDCNNNGIDDAGDIGTFNSEDCDGNGVPDECDIAACAANPDCDDCNLNGIPDACDIGSANSADVTPLDGVPDECADFTDDCNDQGATQNWTCPDNWNLAGEYPDDADSAAGVFATLPNGAVAFLDETVVIPALRLAEGSELQITQTGPQGDLNFSAPAQLEIRGNLLVSGSRIIGGGVPPEVVVGPEGVYEASGAAAAGGVSAALTASSLSVVGSDCIAEPCPHGGEVVLTESMSITTTGDLLIDGRLANGECAPHPRQSAKDPPWSPLIKGGGNAQAAMSFHTPPSIRIQGPSTGQIGGTMVMSGAAGFTLESTQPFTIGGDFDNQSVRPDCFHAHDGIIRLAGSGPQQFEVAATDSGGTGPTAEQFKIGTLEIAAGSQVTFVDAFDNDLLPGASCGEAQYVGTLILEANANVTVQNCRLYYDTLIADPTATISYSGCAEVRESANPAAVTADPTGLSKSRAISFVPPGQANLAVSSFGTPAGRTKVARDFSPWNTDPSVPASGGRMEVSSALRAEQLGSTVHQGLETPGNKRAPSGRDDHQATLGGPADAAIRVTLVSLHHVNPPYPVGPSVPFTSFEGQVRWAGPPAQYMESSATGIPFKASILQCTPHYRDWSTVGLLHVFGSAIVPSSSYRVHVLAKSCEGIEDRCTAISAPLTVTTSRWADVEIPYNPPSNTAQPDVGDISALVSKFRSVNDPIKARALLAGTDQFGNINIAPDLSFAHISACVDAFRGQGYPYTISVCP